MTRLTTEELIRKKEAGESFLLVNVLDPRYFRKQHIPGSINIPADAADFIEKIEGHVQSRDDVIVVHCADTDCQASPRAARRLDEAGFTRVYDYEAGMKGWIKAGRPVDRGGKAA